MSEERLPCIRYCVEVVVRDPEGERVLHDGDDEEDFRNRIFDRVLRDRLNSAMQADPRIIGWYRIVREERRVVA